MRVPSRQQIRAGFKVLGFVGVPIWFITSRSRKTYSEHKERKYALETATAFVNAQENGTLPTRLSRGDFKRLRNIEALLARKHVELQEEIETGKRRPLSFDEHLRGAIRAFQVRLQDAREKREKRQATANRENVT
ncbi:hypothetical protein M408DRAFT_18821 [Serendipita vermifera MAFF 305830]|uniref:Uncharacterized protein n=1 Tax=Serendipita vermifera MAFF 305830 TaxID=933852 RepID=A0A0C3BQU2_SERVB|nr:hypothetical protein M408DRAFT_18821 [Serendipita vermifera MAFF 305830]